MASRREGESRFGCPGVDLYTLAMYSMDVILDKPEDEFQRQLSCFLDAFIYKWPPLLHIASMNVLCLAKLTAKDLAYAWFVRA